MGRFSGIAAPFVFFMLAALTPSGAMAAAPQEFQFKGSVVTQNNFPNAYLWITIYDVGRTRQYDYGCVEPGQRRTWQQAIYETAHGMGKAGHLKVRGELMTQPGCKGVKLCDTTMESAPGKRLIFHRNKTDLNKCYWNYPQGTAEDDEAYFVGGYTKSCTNIKTSMDSANKNGVFTYNVYLTARCRKANQTVVNSSLKMSNALCRGSVENQDGKLYCR